MQRDRNFGEMEVDVGESDMDMESEMSWFKGFFGFVLVLALLMMAGLVYVVYLLLDHFGVLMAGVLL